MKLRSISQSIRKNLKRNARVDQEQGGAKERLSRKGVERQKDKSGLLAPYPPRSSSALPFLSLPASHLAAACGIPIKYETLPLAFGRVIYLAEASLQPPGITVNTTAVAFLAEAAAQTPIEHREWFTEIAITEVVIAHELSHILRQQPSSKSAERLAHEFAQTLTGLSFSPQVYEAVLKQAVKCQITKNTI